MAAPSPQRIYTTQSAISTQKGKVKHNVQKNFALL